MGCVCKCVCMGRVCLLRYESKWHDMNVSRSRSSFQLCLTAGSVFTIKLLHLSFLTWTRSLYKYIYKNFFMYDFCFLHGYALGHWHGKAASLGKDWVRIAWNHNTVRWRFLDKQRHSDSWLTAWMRIWSDLLKLPEHVNPRTFWILCEKLPHLRLPSDTL